MVRTLGNGLALQSCSKDAEIFVAAYLFDALPPGMGSLPAGEEPTPIAGDLNL